MLTQNEKSECDQIKQIIEKVRQLLSKKQLGDEKDFVSWYYFLSEIKKAQGNIHNRIHFVGTLLAKQYLMSHFKISSFDTASKSQSAKGLDIDVYTERGERIIAEVKTTDPLKKNDFGAQQKDKILGDIKKLINETAHYKFMFVTEFETFWIIRENYFRSTSGGISLVDLVRGKEYHK